MPFYVYILHCSDGSFYVGHTDDLETRIAMHEDRSYRGYTAKRLPVRLVWWREFEARAEAFAFERKVKGWSRAKKQALIDGDISLLRRLALRYSPQPE